MKKYILYLVVVLSFNACKNRDHKKFTPIDSNNMITIKLPEEYTHLSNLNSIIQEVQYIPLETSKECLLRNPRKAIFRDGRYYVLDFKRGLYVFDQNGKFLHQIGKRGKGPGEIRDINDFDFDEQGNVLILDYKRVLRYDVNGNFKDNYLRFNFMNEEFYANIYQFAFTGIKSFFVWSGTLGIKDHNPNNFAMYKLENNELVNNYFGLQYKLSDKQHRFIKSGNEVLVNPVLGNDTIYSIKDNELYAKYSVEFEHPVTRESIPKELKSLSDFGFELLNSKSISYNILNPMESNKWLSFAFTYRKNRIITFYNKEKNSVYTIKGFSPSSDNRSIITPYYFHFTYDNSFCSLVTAKEFKTIEDGILQSETPLKRIGRKENEVSAEDNFVILKYVLNE